MSDIQNTGNDPRVALDLGEVGAAEGEQGEFKSMSVEQHPVDVTRVNPFPENPELTKLFEREINSPLSGEDLYKKGKALLDSRDSKGAAVYYTLAHLKGYLQATHSLAYLYMRTRYGVQDLNKFKQLLAEISEGDVRHIKTFQNEILKKDLFSKADWTDMAQRAEKQSLKAYVHFLEATGRIAGHYIDRLNSLLNIEMPNQLKGSVLYQLGKALEDDNPALSLTYIIKAIRIGSAEAFEYLEDLNQLADQSNPEVLFQLSLILQENLTFYTPSGKTSEQNANPDKSRKYMMKAVELGHPQALSWEESKIGENPSQEAIQMLADGYRHRTFALLEMNPPQAEEAQRTGQRSAHFYQMLEKYDPQEAVDRILDLMDNEEIEGLFPILVSMADSGNPYALCELGDYYTQEPHLNLDLAYEYFTKAIGVNDNIDERIMGKVSGEGGLMPTLLLEDLRRSYNFLIHFVEKGHPKAEFYLALWFIATGEQDEGYQLLADVIREGKDKQDKALIHIKSNGLARLSLSNPAAMYVLGQLYEDDPSKGLSDYLDLYKKAAEQGHQKSIERLHILADEKNVIEAQYILGSFYKKGTAHLAMNPKLAFQFFEKGAQNNHEASKFEYAKCFLFGFGVEQDIDKGFELLNELNPNHENLLLLLGNFHFKRYVEEHGVRIYARQQNLVEASTYYNKLFQLYLSQGKEISDLPGEVTYFLGYFTYHGIGAGQNHQEAYAYFSLAALKGHTDATFMKGRMLYDFEGVEEQNMPEGLRYIKKAVILGSQEAFDWMVEQGARDKGNKPEAQIFVAELLATGSKYFEQDVSSALKYFELVKRNAFWPGIHRVAQLFEEIPELPDREKNAFKYYTMAAEDGFYYDSRKRLADIRFHGFEWSKLPENDPLNVKNWTLAREMYQYLIHTLTPDVPEFNYRLGQIYAQGKASTLTDQPNFGTAFMYFKRAADGGHHEAEFVVGKMYLTGQGIERDRGQAKEYLKRAADANNVEAKTLMDRHFGPAREA